ncbi:MAG: Protein kinase domain [Akkermansiaceae bacterium]|nr:Protein kinase domain [Akkermansiaceae bacterium]
MLDIAASVFDRLGLKQQADLSDSFASEARSYQVQDLRGRGAPGSLVLKLYEKDAAGAGSSSGIWDTGRWSTRSADQWSTAAHPNSGGAGDKAVAGPAKIQHLQMNWLVSEQADHHFFPRILEVGEIDQFPYLLREHHPQSLTALARTRVVPNPAMLHQIIAGAWTSLCFLHQPEVNTPHGNLKLSNILIGKGPIQEAEIFLTDTIETPETARKVRKQDDFRALGLILYQMATSDTSQLSFVDALVRADGADWSALGKEGAVWKELAVKLLDEASYRDFNAVAARQAWLDPVRPKKARVIPIPLPLPAAPAGPTLGGDARAKPPQEIAADIDALIQAGDLLGGLRAAAKALTGMTSPDPDLFGRLDYCSAHLPQEALTHSDTLLVLEEAANLGSAPAASRLGQALLSKDADEAFSWLKMAVDRGATEALPALCKLLESGTPSHPPEPAQALACMEKLREIQPGEETDYLLAAMILRGKIGRAANEAVRLLDSLHERGHYKSSDLLAQCHATGTGTEISEKKAYNLFVEAWGRSKTSNEHYYTASNNLGVCFALGFGISKDTESAKHYFRQGALNKHKPSEDNLERLKQAGG